MKKNHLLCNVKIRQKRRNEKKHKKIGKKTYIYSSKNRQPTITTKDNLSEDNLTEDNQSEKIL